MTVSNISEDEERSGAGLHDTVAALTSTVLDSVMTLARHYTWPSVRSLYGAVLEDVQYGSSDWSVSVVGYRDALLTPMNLLAAPATRGEPDETSMARTRKPGVGENTQICRKFNWETGHRSPCPYLHICSSCMRYHGSRESHKAKECAGRAEFLNTQRQAATPGTPNISGSGSGTSNGGSFWPRLPNLPSPHRGLPDPPTNWPPVSPLDINYLTYAISRRRSLFRRP